MEGDANHNNDNVLGYRKNSPYEWLVRVNISNPSILTLTERFDRGWIASMPGKEIESILVNGIVNGFYIDKVGTYDILLQYKPQTALDLGVIISMSTVAAYIGYFLFTRKQRPRISSMA